VPEEFFQAGACHSAHICAKVQASEGGSMPTTKSIFDEIDEEEEERALAEAEKALAEGHVVPHEEVVKWVKSWGTPNELPRPKSK
jgi:predicted transcriptional regulator